MTQAAPDSLPTRHSLLNRIKDLGDDASWREFFDVYWELIYNLARKTGLSDAEAQDVVQDTVIGVSRNIGGFRTGAQHGSFKAWLRQQTRWRIADQFRKREKFVASPETEPTEHDRQPYSADDGPGTAAINRVPDPASAQLDKAWDSEWEKHLLKAALERVKAQTRAKQFQMFDLHELQGLSVSETAQAVGSSRAAVYMAASRLRRLLRREVDRLELARL